MRRKQDEKDEIKRNREAQLTKMVKQMKLVGKNVVYPTYKFDERLKIYREDIPPPVEVFMSVGYDPKYDSKQKHYRRFYEDELENIKEIIPRSPFMTYKIMRGQARGLSKSWFSKDIVDESGQISDVREVGQFKGIVTVINKDKQEGFEIVKQTRINILKDCLNKLSQGIFNEPFDFNYDKLLTAEGRELFQAKLQQLGCDQLNIPQHFTEMSFNEELTRLMMRETECLIRVYILTVEDLPPKDIGGSWDPYIILKLNRDEINERENYTPNSHNADILKMFEFTSEFPGCGHLKMQVWDYDRVFGDDFIGETVVDLEDRFFSPEWQSLKNKPIEFRQLYHKSTKVSQGIIKCWIEIIPTETLIKNEIPWNISRKPPSDFEVRLVVWETKDAKVMDWEGTSDVYVRAFFDSVKQNKRTDTHYRSMDGKGSFNYRLLYDIAHPSKNQVLNLQLWDADLLSSNEYMGETSLNLALLFEDSSLVDKPISLTKKYYDSYLSNYMNGSELIFEDDNSFWVDFKNKTGEINGRARIQLDIYPKEQAKDYEVGEARSEPNHSPFLPPPLGRIKLTINPWEMLNQVISPEIKNKILSYLCILVCIIIMIILIPSIMSQIIAGAIF